MFRKLFLLSAALLMVAGASCAAPEPQADYASEQVCEDIVLFITSVEALQDESQYPDPNALQAQFQVVRTNFSSLVASVQNLESAEKDDFETAVDRLMEEVSKLPEDASVTDTLTSLAEPIQQVLDTSENLQTGLECK